MEWWYNLIGTLPFEWVQPLFMKNAILAIIIVLPLFGILSTMIAVIVTMTLSWVGLLIINSLLVLPAAISRNISANVRVYNFYAILVALTAGVSGILISFYAGTAVGATMVLILGAFFLITFSLEINLLRFFKL